MLEWSCVFDFCVGSVAWLCVAELTSGAAAEASFVGRWWRREFFFNSKAARTHFKATPTAASSIDMAIRGQDMPDSTSFRMCSLRLTLF